MPVRSPGHDRPCHRLVMTGTLALQSEVGTEPRSVDLSLDERRSGPTPNAHRDPPNARCPSATVSATLMRQGQQAVIRARPTEPIDGPPRRCAAEAFEANESGAMAGGQESKSLDLARRSLHDRASREPSMRFSTQPNATRRQEP